MDKKQILEIYKKNLEVNGKDKLSCWLYSECLELASALVAIELHPTPEHLKEVYEEIADVKILLEQYFIFHKIEETYKNIKLDIPIEDNCQMANLFSTQGYFVKHVLNYPAAQMVLKALDELECDKYASPEIMKIYDFKIKRLAKRLQNGFFSGCNNEFLGDFVK